MLVWDLIALVIILLSAGLGCFCTIPVNIMLVAISSFLLNAYTKQHPELFGP